MNLSDCPIGKILIIKKLNIKNDLIKFRLFELGLGEGAIVSVLSQTICGGRVITRSRSRIGIDKLTAKSIEVEIDK